MDRPDWQSLIEESRLRGRRVVNAVTYRRTWDTTCQPVQVTCDDGHDYVIKGWNTGRSAFNDQVVGRIAHAIGAPVAEVELVDVVPELVAINSKGMKHLPPGTAHGSRFVPGCTGSEWFRHVDLPENRPRFALLAILYGWLVGSDRQFFYTNDPSRSVYSFDHDAFFHGGPGWTIETLTDAPDATQDLLISGERGSGLTRQELEIASAYLERITPEIIAMAIASPPAEWNIVSRSEQVALAQYLWERRASFQLES